MKFFLQGERKLPLFYAGEIPGAPQAPDKILGWVPNDEILGWVPNDDLRFPRDFWGDA